MSKSNAGAAAAEPALPLPRMLLPPFDRDVLEPSAADADEGGDAAPADLPEAPVPADAAAAFLSGLPPPPVPPFARGLDLVVAPPALPPVLLLPLRPSSPEFDRADDDDTSSDVVKSIPGLSDADGAAAVGLAVIPLRDDVAGLLSADRNVLSALPAPASSSSAAAAAVDAADDDAPVFADGAAEEAAPAAAGASGATVEGDGDVFLSRARGLALVLLPLVVELAPLAPAPEPLLLLLFATKDKSR